MVKFEKLLSSSVTKESNRVLKYGGHSFRYVRTQVCNGRYYRKSPIRFEVFRCSASRKCKVKIRRDFEMRPAEYFSNTGIVSHNHSEEETEGEEGESTTSWNSESSKGLIQSQMVPWVVEIFLAKIQLILEEYFKNELDEHQSEIAKGDIDLWKWIESGAGTGKTRTLIALILNNLSITKDILSFLCLVMTRNAQKEICDRIIKLVNDTIDNEDDSEEKELFKKHQKDIFNWMLPIHTFHSYCLKRLNESGAKFDVLESEEVKKIIKELSASEEFIHLHLDLEKAINLLDEVNERLIVNGESADDVKERNSDAYNLHVKFEEKVRRLANPGNPGSKLVRFSEILDRFYYHLKNGDVRFGRNLKTICVDEYQDLSKRQFEILTCICQSRNVFLFGNVDQTIFTWELKRRNLNIPKLISDHFKLKPVYLLKNYRCSRNIDLFSRAVIKKLNDEEKNEKDFEKTCFVLEVKSFEDQAQKVVDSIKMFVETNKENSRTLGILSRTDEPLKKVNAMLKNDPVLEYISYWKEEHTKKKVVLSTIHKSKGSEFTELEIMDVIDKIMPYELKGPLNAEELLSELRLFFVALTRGSEKVKMYVYNIVDKHPLFINSMMSVVGNSQFLKDMDDYFLREKPDEKKPLHPLFKSLEEVGWFDLEPYEKKRKKMEDE